MALECIKGTNVPIVDVIKEAKELFLIRYNYSGWAAMCPAFCNVLINFDLALSVNPDDVPRFINKFNEQIAEEHFQADCQRVFWWPEWDTTKRLEYFDWLIEQYSKEI